jgi:nicotinamide-nucleotide amidase
VGDRPDAIIAAVRQSMNRADLVVVTGGLGPTHDDITKKTLCRLFKCGTRFNPSVMRRLNRQFKRRGRKTPEISRQYAYIPTAAVPVENRMGIAPGLFFRKKVLVMPGVPIEMETMLSDELPKLIPHTGLHIRERTLHLCHISEPDLVAKLSSLDAVLKKAEVAFLPRRGRVAIRIITKSSSARQAAAQLRSAEKALRKDVEEYIWGTDDDTIEEVVGNHLRRRGKKLAVAESCTGGGIGESITRIAGSSDYFPGGVIAYSDEVKVKQLGVTRMLLAKHGAVSGQVAVAMARGVRRKFGADYGLSATGIAGPGGGTKQKPVGLTWVALSGPEGDASNRLLLAHDRPANRDRTVFEALHLLLKVFRDRLR